MELIFLGTSSGTPTKERNVSAVALRKKSNKHWSLIDCGEGTQHQLLHTNLSMQQLDAIYITHIHGDKTKTSSIKEIEDEARSIYENKLFLANDFEVYGLNREGELVSPC